ncbi:unnamed protein product [Ciceribacter selenitireducens ATCC BAA-1503]|uniref:Uncharacterized protein n=1 Tax=Ciceribacter selenitireducens ATCC BAA-1503 TaxID=1336235 RepID=A0A376AB85_9HYPH|nr:unnamed protein product [Ciceribacter selenitireducens ATCC BAA-1503]
MWQTGWAHFRRGQYTKAWCLSSLGAHFFSDPAIAVEGMNE